MYAQVARVCTSFIDVPGKIALAIYFSGCSLRCKDCQNQELWDPCGGEKTSIDTLIKQINDHPLAQAVVFLGGEPTDQIEFLQELCKQITDKEKVLYTGREFELLPTSLLHHLTMIICGPYNADLHIDAWPASTNQRLLLKKENQWIRQTTYPDTHKIFKSSTTRSSQKY